MPPFQLLPTELFGLRRTRPASRLARSTLCTLRLAGTGCKWMCQRRRDARPFFPPRWSGALRRKTSSTPPRPRIRPNAACASSMARRSRTAMRTASDSVDTFNACFSALTVVASTMKFLRAMPLPDAICPSVPVCKFSWNATHHCSNRQPSRIGLGPSGSA